MKVSYCNLCDVGFPVEMRDGVRMHIPTQRHGMIPATPCKQVENLEAEIARVSGLLRTAIHERVQLHATLEAVLRRGQGGGWAPKLLSRVIDTLYPEAKS